MRRTLRGEWSGETKGRRTFEWTRGRTNWHSWTGLRESKEEK